MSSSAPAITDESIERTVRAAVEKARELRPQGERFVVLVAEPHRERVAQVVAGLEDLRHCVTVETVEGALQRQG